MKKQMQHKITQNYRDKVINDHWLRLAHPLVLIGRFLFAVLEWSVLCCVQKQKFKRWSLLHKEMSKLGLEMLLSIITLMLSGSNGFPFPTELSDRATRELWNVIFNHLHKVLTTCATKFTKSFCAFWLFKLRYPT